MAYYQPNQINPELLKGLGIAESAEQNVPVTTAPPAPTNGYVVDKSLVPQENLPTMNDIYTAQYADERQRDFKNNFPYPSLSPSEFAARNQVHTLKTAWQQAQEGINALDPAQNADTISKLRQVQKDSSDAANILRNTALAMGWNMKGMGADDSLALSTQLINMDRQRGMNELYNMPTTAAQKREYYEQMVRRGVAPHVARDVANLKGDEFREQNISRLIEGIGAYGSNGDGSLNEFGQMLAGKLYTEAPYQYGNIVNSFASPKELFNVNANMAQAEMQNQSAWDRAKLNAQNAWDISEARLKQSSQQHADNMKYNYDKLNVDVAEKIAKLESANQNNIQKEIQDLADAVYGGDYNKAAQAYARQKYSKSFEVDRNEDGSIKLSDMDKIKNKVEFRMATIEDYINQGNMEEAKMRIDEWRMAMQSEDFKDAEYLDKESATFMLDLLKLYDDVADRKITMEQYQQKLKELRAKNYAELIKETPSASTDQQLADIMNTNKRWREWNNAGK